MWNVFVRIHTVCAGYFYPTGDEPKVTRDVGALPNITGELGYMRDDTDVYHFASGAFSIASDGSGYTGETRVAGIKWTFSANRSNSAYAASDTVQPSSLRGLPCIKF